MWTPQPMTSHHITGTATLSVALLVARHLSLESDTSCPDHESSELELAERRDYYSERYSYTKR